MFDGQGGVLENGWGGNTSHETEGVAPLSLRSASLCGCGRMLCYVLSVEDTDTGGIAPTEV